jgi:hypothetical protein
MFINTYLVILSSQGQNEDAYRCEMVQICISYCENASAVTTVGDTKLFLNMKAINSLMGIIDICLNDVNVQKIKLDTLDKTLEHEMKTLADAISKACEYVRNLSSDLDVFVQETLSMVVELNYHVDVCDLYYDILTSVGLATKQKTKVANIRMFCEYVFVVLALNRASVLESLYKNNASCVIDEWADALFAVKLLVPSSRARICGIHDSMIGEIDVVRNKIESVFLPCYDCHKTDVLRVMIQEFENIRVSLAVTRTDSEKVFIRVDACHILLDIENTRSKIKEVYEAKCVYEAAKLVYDSNRHDAQAEQDLNTSLYNFQQVSHVMMVLTSDLYCKSTSLVAAATNVSGTVPNPEYVVVLRKYEEAVSNAVAENWREPWKTVVIELELALSNTTAVIVSASELLDLCVSIRRIVQTMKDEVDGHIHCLDALTDSEIIEVINNLADCTDIERIRKEILEVVSLSERFVKFMDNIKCSINYEELIEARLTQLYNFLCNNDLVHLHETTILTAKAELCAMIDTYRRLVKCNAEKMARVSHKYDGIKDRIKSMTTMCDTIHANIKECKSGWDKRGCDNKSFYVSIVSSQYVYNQYCSLEHPHSNELFFNPCSCFVWDIPQSKMLYTGCDPIFVILKMESLSSDVSCFDTRSKFYVVCFDETNKMVKQSVFCQNNVSEKIRLTNNMCFKLRPLLPMKLDSCIISIYYDTV